MDNKHGSFFATGNELSTSLVLLCVENLEKGKPRLVKLSKAMLTRISEKPHTDFYSLLVSALGPVRADKIDIQVNGKKPAKEQKSSLKHFI